MSGPTPRWGILVGVDGSACSAAAVRWAACEATMRNIPLTLVHVIAGPVVTGLPILAIPATPIQAEFFEQREEGARQMLSDAIRVAEDSAAGNSSTKVNAEVFFSAPAATLVEQSKDAEMVVVGSRGQSTWHRALLGWVSTALVHHAHCPVAVIHDELSSQRHRPGSSVLLGIDGSPASELATAIAFDEASRRGAELVALHACNDGDIRHIPTMEWSAWQSAAEKTLAERLAGWQERYPDVSIRRLIEWEQPARHLIDRAQSAQLVVVGSHGRGGFAGMLLGSVSTAVVHAADVPVIVARRR
ncbi:MAG: universal stress protein [Mycobacterium sp.]|nr:universal stress protein [Mycobacterium sp.]